MTGSELKKFILAQNVYLWQVAEKLNMNDGNFSRRLRKDFSDTEVQKINAIIEEIKSE